MKWSAKMAEHLLSYGVYHTREIYEISLRAQGDVTKAVCTGCSAGHCISEAFHSNELRFSWNSGSDVCLSRSSVLKTIVN